MDIALGLLGLTTYVAAVAIGVFLFKRSDARRTQRSAWHARVVVSHKHDSLLAPHTAGKWKFLSHP